MAQTLAELIEVLRDPELPYSEWNAQFAALHGRMPQKLDAQLAQIVDRGKSRQPSSPSRNLSRAFQKFLDDHVAAADTDLLKSTLKPLTDILGLYAEGAKVRELSVISDLLEMYADTERLFSGRRLRTKRSS